MKGANWSPIDRLDGRTYKWECITFHKLWNMIPTGLVLVRDLRVYTFCPLSKPCVQKLPSRVYYQHNDNLDQVWYKDLVQDFCVMEPSEIPAGAQGGVKFTTISVNPEVYLPWLKSELLARGVQFIRKRVHSLSEAAALTGPNGIIVNATGLGARSLMGVEDTTVFPIRGQTVIVHAPSVKEFISFPLGSASNGEATYMIPRPSPAGHVLLGGTFQLDNWDTSIDYSTAKGIIERCAALAPSLADKETRILSHNVGLRPARKNGPRVEVEWVDSDAPKSTEGTSGPGRVMVVHAYGFGPAGYQNSWGAAEEVVSLIGANLNKSA
ncbi:hypothetical protein AcW1_001084 [Taiwanofungus camphoratus]|nr:hypothetical protein AcV5_004998 [Antrodia cinnamomea]KAI0962213.1 hypothetical protein AcV7_001105 [Antrodia cinnamomea]KAI0964213.1 hypothetical protein AcW1_001084 [Antrodia cinnamomea]